MAATPSNDLHQLPSHTQSKLRSTQILVSLPQIISELVQNSLDADASQIDIGVDCEDWSCWVRDNGHGISKADLVALQSAERYGTSKAYSNDSLGEVSTFGFRGEALASTADLCCLEICSRTARSRETYSLILKGGETLYSGPAIRWRRASSGTVICIRDAFYNLPIRRRSHSSSPRTIELIRKELESFSLVFPHVSFTLENTHRLDTLRPGNAGQITKIPKTSSSLHSFRNLFGRALVEHVHEVNVTSDDVNINGFISLSGAQSKAYQFLYINRHLITPCNLHRAIESRFNASTFAKHALDDYHQLSQTRDAVRRSPRKVDKKPVYVLNISICSKQIDNCVEPVKNAVQLQNSEHVVSFLSSVVQTFLEENGFAIERSRQENMRHPSSPRKRRRVDKADDLHSIALIRASALPSDSQAPLVHPQGNANDAVETGSSMIWTNALTGETYVIDKRTGNSYSTNAERKGDDTSDGQHRRTLNTVFQQDFVDNGSETPTWLKAALLSNPTYTMTGARIPSLSTSSNFAKTVEDAHNCRGQRASFQDQALSLSRAESRLMQFSKLDLQKAFVLGQVDRKFIACFIPKTAIESITEPTGTLVLIDQHAADERIRVERFIQTLCGTSASGPPTRTLQPPKSILLTHHEAQALRGSQDFVSAFSRWGFHFSEPNEEDSRALDDIQDKSYVQVEVQSVPDVVADKLLSEDHLRDLVKSYLHELGDSGSLASAYASQARETGDGQFAWQRSIQWCPQDLRELVNSKACRGAIMFNDPLSKERCERLIKELCETALPFQCAHGRPSLVPLTCVQGDVAEQQASRRVKRVDWAGFKYRMSRRRGS